MLITFKEKAKGKHLWQLLENFTDQEQQNVEMMEIEKDR